MGRAVGERVAAPLAGHQQRGRHPLSRLEVPAPAVQPAGGSPQHELPLVRAGRVAARHEHESAPGDARESAGRVTGAANTRRVAGRPDDREVVRGHLPSAHAVPRGHERLLGRRRVGEEDVGVSSLAHAQRLARSHRDHAQPVSGRAFEDRREAVEEARVLKRRRGRENDVAARRRLLGDGRRRRERQHEGERVQCAHDARKLARRAYIANGG